MVKVMQRLIQQIKPDKWEALEEIDKKFNAVEASLGYPPTKRRYRLYSGKGNFNTLIVEREWNSLKELEELTVKGLANPDLQKLMAELNDTMSDMKIEIYLVWPMAM